MKLKEYSDFAEKGAMFDIHTINNKVRKPKQFIVEYLRQSIKYTLQLNENG